MKDTQKIAQSKRLEEVIVYLKTTTRELSHIAGVHENTLYKICCGHSSISSRTAARICYNIEKQYGVCINRQWLITGEGSMLNDHLPSPMPYKQDEDEQPTAMVAEAEAEFGFPDYREKYMHLMEEHLELQKKYTDLLENKA